jgi:hypothetical protein
MTKLTNDSDFRIYVRPQIRERQAPESQFFAGIYTVTLNTFVDISFIPDVSDFCPPWREDLVPNGEEATSELEARVFQALISEYSVTPNMHLAGRIDVVQLPAQRPPDPELDPWWEDYVGPQYGKIWYLAADDWQPLYDELDGLWEVAYSDVHSVRLSQMANTRLGRFLEDRFLPSGRLSERHLQILGRTRS